MGCGECESEVFTIEVGMEELNKLANSKEVKEVKLSDENVDQMIEQLEKALQKIKKR